VGVPLISQETLIGFLWMGRQTDVTEMDVRLLSAVADIAANAIHRTTLHEQTQKDAADLALAYDTTLQGWAHTLELRDQETEGHSQRVVEMTLRLAKRFAVDESELVHIRRGAILHDIGKMGIPDSILRKPGPLTDEEWEIMRKHPVHAYNLLSPIAHLRPAIDIPYYHHEKWDGSGYPCGLKGEQIPLSARLFAVVDVWDALRFERPYHSPWPDQNAFDYIQQEAGKHFDPAVVAQFLQEISGR
jgi:HD-GYP domain-containing protein (c-di-GMP phosphodiesterase class II)